MPLPFHAALFDLDGTLIDSAVGIAEAVNRTLEELGHARADEATVLEWIGEGARILLVDNDQPTREQLTSMLQEWGHDVSAFDGTQIEPIAQAALNASVWLLDFHLDDGRTGIDVYRDLLKQMPDRPTLVLTADISDQVRAICQELDLTLVRKPIRALALRSVLMRLLSASNAARA